LRRYRLEPIERGFEPFSFAQKMHFPTRVHKTTLMGILDQLNGCQQDRYLNECGKSGSEISRKVAQRRTFSGCIKKHTLVIRSILPRKIALSVGAILVLIGVARCARLDGTQRVIHQQTISPVRHFVEVAFDRFPQSVIKRDFCNEPDDRSGCWRDIRSTGKVWAGDVNGDHIDELILFPGVRAAGSGGRNYYLYQRQGTNWQSIVIADDSEGWFTDRPRFDILPITRSGYRDLRIAVNDCLKWSDGKYVLYDPADYAALEPTWFDATDPHQAEIFWAMGHAKTEASRLDPQWFPISPVFFSEHPGQKKPNRQQTQQIVAEWHDDGAFPRFVIAAVDDGAQEIRWVSLQRACVWGIRRNRAFLLVLRPSYLGVGTLTISDWLLGHETCVSEDELDVRYNLLTHELQITTPEELL